jgi:hypothetical protein
MTGRWVGAAAFLGVLAACNNQKAEPQEAASGPTAGEAQETSSAPAAAARRWAALSADAPAPLSTLAAEAPQLEKDAQAQVDLVAIWKPENETSLRLLLTALSSAMRFGGFTGELRKLLDDPKNQPTKQAAIKLWSLLERQNKYPDAFMDQLDAYLDRIAVSPNLGLWKEGDAGHDFTAIAAWMRRKDPSYVREFTAAAARGGQWQAARSRHPLLRSEQGALMWLAKLGKLTDQERQRARELTYHKLKEPFALGSFRVTISSVEARGEIGKTVATTGARYVVARLALENLGKAPASEPQHAIVLRDTKDRQFTPVRALQLALQASDVLGGPQVTNEYQPGVPSPSSTVFEVPADVVKDGFSITFGDPETGALGGVEIVGQ